jgi:hypothetical protein
MGHARYVQGVHLRSRETIRRSTRRALVLRPDGDTHELVDAVRRVERD